MKKDQKFDVFLVDDDKTYLGVLEHTLKHDIAGNIGVLKTFSTGEECINELQQQHAKPDIIVLDYFLNSSSKDAANGVNILRKIKSINKDIQVIMLSSQEKLEVAVNTIKLGAHDYVIKNESAFIRVGHLIKIIMHNINLNKRMNRYEKWNWVIAALFLIAIFSLGFYGMTKHGGKF